MEPQTIRKAAVIGGGVIGGGWAARFALNGIDVAIHDPHPEAEARYAALYANARRAHDKLTLAPAGPRGAVTFASSIEAAVADAGFIQESVPERLDLKRDVLGAIDAAAPADALICSSTSGLLPTELQAGLARPGRMMVGHPFNPVYLLPLVEVCGGEKTGTASIERASGFYTSLGMKPLIVRREIDGFIADRLMEALWREALWLVHDDIATVEEVDDAISFGAGLRWAIMGSFLNFRLAGGEDGMRHFMAQFGPALKWPWTKLMDVPELTDDFLDKIVAQSDAQAAGRDFRDLERTRDDCLIAIMQGLKGHGTSAGTVLKDYEARLYSLAHEKSGATEHDFSKPLELFAATVAPDWTDYNGHMTEFRYLQVFGDATDAFMRLIGMTDEFRSGGYSLYTVETHIMHLMEISAGEPLAVVTQLLSHDEKRIRVFHEMRHGDTGDLLATGEHMLLHVDTEAGRACEMSAEMAESLTKIWAGHRQLSTPKKAGRAIGEKMVRPRSWRNERH